MAYVLRNVPAPLLSHSSVGDLDIEIETVLSSLVRTATDDPVRWVDIVIAMDVTSGFCSGMRDVNSMSDDVTACVSSVDLAGSDFGRSRDGHGISIG